MTNNTVTENRFSRITASRVGASLRNGTPDLTLDGNDVTVGAAADGFGVTVGVAGSVAPNMNVVSLDLGTNTVTVSGTSFGAGIRALQSDNTVFNVAGLGAMTMEDFLRGRTTIGGTPIVDVDATTGTFTAVAAGSCKTPS